MKRKQHLQLPQGIDHVEYVHEESIGDYLRIHMVNGFVVTVDALNLSDYECNIAVFPSNDENDDAIASVAFDRDLPAEVWSRA